MGLYLQYLQVNIMLVIYKSQNYSIYSYQTLSHTHLRCLNKEKLFFPGLYKPILETIVVRPFSLVKSCSKDAA